MAKFCTKCGLELYPEEKECPECRTPAPRERRPVNDNEDAARVSTTVDDDFYIPKKKSTNTNNNKKLKLKSKFLKGLIIGFSVFFGFIVLLLIFGEEQEPNTAVEMEQQNIQQVQIEINDTEIELPITESNSMNLEEKPRMSDEELEIRRKEAREKSEQELKESWDEMTDSVGNLWDSIKDSYKEAVDEMDRQYFEEHDNLNN